MIKEDLKVTEQNMYSVYPKEEIKRKGKDLTNFQCNDILVLYKTSSIKIGNATKAAWVCKCLDCGNIIKRRTDYLYQKRIISCGCKNFPGPVNIKRFSIIWLPLEPSFPNFIIASLLLHLGY